MLLPLMLYGTCAQNNEKYLHFFLYKVVKIVYNDHVRNKKQTDKSRFYMYKFTQINYCHSSQIFGGGTATETIVSFSKSPKIASSRRGTVIRHATGDTECPQLTFESLEHNGKLIKQGWS